MAEGRNKNRSRNSNDDFRFEIVNHYGVLSTNDRGWSKELNSVKWNGNKAKYDIRDWNPEHEKMGRGITMNEEEFSQLSELITSGSVEMMDDQDFDNAGMEGAKNGLYDAEMSA